MADTHKETLILDDADRGGIIHVANIKGGVGKSTLATNLAASLSKKGPTLLIDLDVQGSASVALGVDLSSVFYTSWDLFERRYSVRPPFSFYAETFDIPGMFAKAEEIILGGINNGGPIETTVVNITRELHLSPAGDGLFNAPNGRQYGNFLHNLNILRNRYRYIVLDTPSVWNKLTRTLYINSDLNLIPVTLNALSTNSLREYLVHVKKLAAYNQHVRLRIVKNEVLSVGVSETDGRQRTINTNRRFLDSLCEQVALRNDTGCALLPQSIMFDLEIPESSAIRDAQDAGKSVHDYESDSAVAEAFNQLAKNVQYVLNGIHRENITASAFEEKVMTAFKLCAAALVIAVFGMSKPIPELPPPRPLAPQQMIESSGQNAAITHTFAKGDNVTRLAKHAISAFRAVVPTQQEINEYVAETIEAHNLTRIPGEPQITDIYRIPAGLELTFYPPMNLTNKQEKTMIPVYRYFMNLVDDAYPYVTGDWCERGMGGGQPHYGMDVAGAYGSDVISPVDGQVVLKTDNLVGRTVGVTFDQSIVFFSHLEKRYVKDGDVVKKGEPIGTIGMTGRTSGPHVHIGYGIKSMSRHDLSFGKQSYRVSDPKHFFYQMAYVESAE